MSLCTDKPILVTGASGFIATHIVERLLKKGYKVRGTVRSTSDPKYAYLKEFENGQNLELVETNLNYNNGWLEAVKGCEIVIHTASPFVLNVQDAQRDLVDPAVNGVNLVLTACLDAGGVKKVVLTSSVGAICGKFEAGKTYNESYWNNTSNLNHNPYFYSKTMAERAAHEFINKHNHPFKLAVINPMCTIGPAHRTIDVNQSVAALKRFMSGVDISVPNVGDGYVDVRDVADAHILAAEKLEAEGRFILHENSYSWPTIAGMIKKLYPKYPVPTLKAPSFVTKAVAKWFYSAGDRDFVLGGLDKLPQLDNSRSKDILGVKYTAFVDTVKDCCDDLINKGLVTSNPKPKYFGVI